MKSFIRWAGSKRKILRDLEALWIESGSERYIEPFCGSACLFFHIEPGEAILGDTNEWLCLTLDCISEDPDAVFDKLSTMTRNKEIFKKVRSIHYSKFSKINAAAYFLYLNRLCFNGLFRTNKKGLFNVPYADNKTGPFPSQEVLRNASAILKNAKVLSADFFETVVENLEENDFVYLDPPYATANVRVFRQYSPFTFGIEDIQRLSSLLRIIDLKGGKFVMSYADTTEIAHLKSTWHCQYLAVLRNISGFTKGRKRTNEVVITNF
ncbi:MAG: Dam family site-specific DNA-(adenine-N6)-methyltransferase [Candidatus Thiodiazotropha sp.]